MQELPLVANGTKGVAPEAPRTGQRLASSRPPDRQCLRAAGRVSSHSGPGRLTPLAFRFTVPLDGCMRTGTAMGICQVGVDGSAAARHFATICPPRSGCFFMSERDVLVENDPRVSGLTLLTMLAGPLKDSSSPHKTTWITAEHVSAYPFISCSRLSEEGIVHAREGVKDKLWETFRINLDAPCCKSPQHIKTAVDCPSGPHWKSIPDPLLSAYYPPSCDHALPSVKSVEQQRISPQRYPSPAISTVGS